MYNQQAIMCKICKKRVFANVWKMHVMGKKHLHFTPKKIRVSVSADKSQIDEIHEYFAKFGTIGTKEVISCENGKVVIDYTFQSRTMHSLIIYKDHHLFHEPVKITWEEVDTPLPTPSTILPATRGRPQNFQKSIKKDAELSTKTILNNVKSAVTFKEQMSVLLKNLQTDRESLEQKKKLICEDLSAALAPMFALHKICFFGSSVTQLDTQVSDLDIYIENVREDSRPELGTLKIIRNLIFKCRKFCDVLLISGAKIPIIKCIHTKTQICCDLTIRNKLSVCNSELIRYYISLDDKLPSLMMMVKFWADCYDLKKVNYFSSYALYMMVIFYLQQAYKLPSVRELQKNVKPDLVDGWNSAFEKLQFTSQALKDESILNLVLGFFQFYSNFDYISKVISPYNGAVISKSSFIKPCELPEGFEIYENHRHVLSVNTGICIQDPFELARNVAASVSFQCSGRFMAMCQLTLQLLREEEEKELLYNVLTQKSENYVFSLFKIDIEEQVWEQAVKNKMAKILTDVLNVTVVRQRNSNPFLFKCTGEKNIWENRINIYKNLMTQLPLETSSVQREIAATKCITKYFPQTLPVFFTIELNFKENKVDFVLKQTSKRSKNFFHVAHFFYINFLTFLSMDENLEADKQQDIVIPETVIKEEIDVKNKAMTEVDVKVEEEDKSGKTIDSNENQGSDEDTAKPVTEVSNAEEADFKDEEDEDIEDEEDVPPDFFDDFSNQDFMDGLDIVDAWDDDKPTDDTERSEEKERKPHSPIRFIESSERRKRYARSSSKSPKRRKRSNTLTRRVRSKSREKVRMERRDPEKTKRDINRDKIKCARDKELKIVSDKLRIVETGLVPPGTEMDVDLNTIFKEKRREENSRSIERSRDIKIRSRERDSDRDRDRDRRILDARERRPLEHERDRRISDRDRDRRPLRRSSSRDRELRDLRKRSPSPLRGRPREREPLYRPRKRTSSMDSNLSDREKWIRRHKRTRTRSRSKSPRRKSKKYEEEKRKKTFLEEIRDKLNETRPSASVPYQMSYPNPVPVPVPGPMAGAPAPVPAPTQYFPPVQQQNYDLNFFIGETYQTGFNNAIDNSGNAIPTQAPAVRAPPSAPLINPHTLQPASNKINILSDIVLKPNEKNDEKGTKEDIDKLFADKKISLSDFLTITAKCEVQSSSPEHLQKKIKVISRCQDAIKALSDDRKLSGRLSVKPTEQPRIKNEVKYQSPLRRIPIVRFQFTSPPKMTEDMDSFAIAMDKVLRTIGLLKGEAEEENIAKLANSSYADEETAALSLKVNILKKSDQKTCEECKKRKAKVLVEVGSQCMDTKETVDVGIQVVEEEINPKPKNESLALLTPAQLLGKEKEKEEKTTKPELEKEEIKQPVKVSPKIPPLLTGRGGFRNTLRDRSGNNNYYEEEEYEYEYQGRGRPGMNSRESFGRYGGPPGRYARGGFMEENHNMRMPQFREQDSNFIDFNQAYRGRGGRFPHRY